MHAKNIRDKLEQKQWKLAIYFIYNKPCSYYSRTDYNPSSTW